jgi:Leucine-rich repeat (LRR) protein
MNKIRENGESLDLRHRNLSRIDVNLLQNVKHLRVLYLDANAIIKIKNLEDLVNLEELSLSKNDITDVEGLTGLRNLTSLNLAKNSINSCKVCCAVNCVN